MLLRTISTILTILHRWLHNFLANLVSYCEIRYVTKLGSFTPHLLLSLWKFSLTLSYYLFAVPPVSMGIHFSPSSRLGDTGMCLVLMESLFILSFLTFISFPLVSYIPFQSLSFDRPRAISLPLPSSLFFTLRELRWMSFKIYFSSWSLCFAVFFTRTEMLSMLCSRSLASRCHGNGVTTMQWWTLSRLWTSISSDILGRVVYCLHRQSRASRHQAG
jgi:hypothetical protein